MAPSSPQLVAHLRHIIWYHLDNNLLENALFLAGRLSAIDARNPEATYLLGLCHLRLNHPRAAIDCTRASALRGTNLACSYLFAQACLIVGRNTEGIAALERLRSVWDSKAGTNRSDKSIGHCKRQEPDQSAVKCLLGKLLQASGDVKRAINYFAEALEINPFMWDAFERLCDSGAALHTSTIFRANPELANLFQILDSRLKPRIQEVSMSKLQSQAVGDNQTLPFKNESLETMKAVSDTGSPQSGHMQHLRSNQGMTSSDTHEYSNTSKQAETPTSSGYNVSALQNIHIPNGSRSSQLEPPNAPIRRTRVQTGILDVGLGTDPTRSHRTQSNERSSFDMNNSNAPESGKAIGAASYSLKRNASGMVQVAQPALGHELIQAPQRRSNRLFKKGPVTSNASGMKDVQDPRKARATGTKGRTSTVGRVVSGNRKILESNEGSLKESRSHLPAMQIGAPHRPTPSEESHRDLETIPWLLDLLAKLGAGYYALSRFHCQDALQAFHELPQQHRETPWVLAQIGKAYYEQNNWSEAAKSFARVRQLVPSRLEDMEKYSTVLWHLKNDSELAFLSHELVESNRLSPEAWCCIGNSFSLQREHDQALRCFKRATQVNGSFAYGFTLQGHEHVANEEFDKALLAYRKALGADYRHYNGWYGLAKVYEKLGKFDVAEKYYRSAATINPNNAILTCCIGMVLEKQRKLEKALQFYKQACLLAPHSTMARYKKARVLMHLHRSEDALEELDILKDLAPDESNVHFMLGRVLRGLDRKSHALRHFTTAMNLDPKAAPYIKETMETMDMDLEHEVEDDDDEMS